MQLSHYISIKESVKEIFYKISKSSPPSISETTYLLSSKNNKKHLLDSIEQASKGEFVDVKWNDN